MTKTWSTIIVNLMTHGSGVLMLGRNHISHYSGNALSSTLSIYSTLIAFVYRIIILLTYVIVDFYLFYDGVDMQI